MNWHKATDQELVTIIACDEMARASDILEAAAELKRRNRKIPKTRTQYKIMEVHSK